MKNGILLLNGICGWISLCVGTNSRLKRVRRIVWKLKIRKILLILFLYCGLKYSLCVGTNSRLKRVREIVWKLKIRNLLWITCLHFYLDIFFMCCEKCAKWQAIEQEFCRHWALSKNNLSTFGFVDNSLVDKFLVDKWHADKCIVNKMSLRWSLKTCSA